MVPHWAEQVDSGVSNQDGLYSTEDYDTHALGMIILEQQAVVSSIGICIMARMY